jgi:ACDE family multidrug resistance protein
MSSQGSSGSVAPGGGSEGLTRPTFAVILTITLTGIMGNVLITAALPDIADDFGLSGAQLGMLVAATTTPGILLAPVIGVLADRFGRREVVVPCLALFGLSGGLASFAPSFWALLGLRFMQGIGSAGLINLAVVIISDHWEGVERTRVLGRNSACLTGAVVVLPPLGGLLTAVGGWRLTFVPYWIGLVSAAVVWVRLPRSTRREGTLRAQVRQTVPVLRSRAVLGPVLLGGFVFVLIFGLFLTAVPLYLADEFKVGPTGRGLVLALPAVTSTIAALSVGRARLRFGLTPVIVLGLGLFTVGFGVAAAVPSVAAVCAAALFYGGGDGLLIATLQDTVAEVAPPESRGTVIATWVGFARLGQTAGPLLSGWGLDTIGPRAVFGVGAGMATLLAVGQRPLLAPAVNAAADAATQARRGAGEEKLAGAPN